MISRIEGELVGVDRGRAQLRMGPIVVEALVATADEQALHARIGETVALLTLFHLEGGSQSTNLVPRLIGFLTAEDRAFFELFTTVKGIGPRKALRALALPVAAVAEAIEAQDVDLLKSLPEVGKRTAETIVAELRGKVSRFVEAKPIAGAAPPTAAAHALARDAVAVLAQLGESPVAARRLVDRALAADPAIDSADALIAAAFRLKGTD